jgi:hypothetical protein
MKMMSRNASDVSLEVHEINSETSSKSTASKASLDGLPSWARSRELPLDLMDMPSLSSFRNVDCETVSLPSLSSFRMDDLSMSSFSYLSASFHSSANQYNESGSGSGSGSAEELWGSFASVGGTSGEESVSTNELELSPVSMEKRITKTTVKNLPVTPPRCPISPSHPVQHHQRQQQQQQESRTEAQKRGYRRKHTPPPTREVEVQIEHTTTTTTTNDGGTGRTLTMPKRSTSPARTREEDEESEEEQESGRELGGQLEQTKSEDTAKMATVRAATPATATIITIVRRPPTGRRGSVERSGSIPTMTRITTTIRGGMEGICLNQRSKPNLKSATGEDFLPRPPRRNISLEDAITTTATTAAAMSTRDSSSEETEQDDADGATDSGNIISTTSPTSVRSIEEKLNESGTSTTDLEPEEEGEPQAGGEDGKQEKKRGKLIRKLTDSVRGIGRKAKSASLSRRRTTRKEQYADADASNEKEKSNGGKRRNLSKN